MAREAEPETEMWSGSQQDSGAQRNTEKQAFESMSKFPDASLHTGELTLV